MVPQLDVVAPRCTCGSWVWKHRARVCLSGLGRKRISGQVHMGPLRQQAAVLRTCFLMVNGQGGGRLVGMA